MFLEVSTLLQIKILRYDIAIFFGLYDMYESLTLVQVEASSSSLLLVASSNTRTTQETMYTVTFTTQLVDYANTWPNSKYMSSLRCSISGVCFYSSELEMLG